MVANHDIRRENADAMTQLAIDIRRAMSKSISESLLAKARMHWAAEIPGVDFSNPHAVSNALVDAAERLMR